MNEAENLQPKKEAAQGLISLWEKVDRVCVEMGWNWTKECRSARYCQVYARPEDMTEWQVGILFNADGPGKPQPFLNTDRKVPITSIQRAETASFIDAVMGNLFIGLGHANLQEYSESDFKRLLPTLAREEITDATASEMQAERDEEASANTPAKSDALEENAVNELRTGLLAMGYPADRVEQAIEEHRREQQMVQATRLEMEIERREQNLGGAYIESATAVYAGAINGEPDGVVIDRRLNGISAQLEELKKILKRQSAPIQQQVMAELPKPSRKQPGRHADPENDTAYQMILDGGSTEESADNAYAYWCKAKNIRKPTQGDRNNFNQAMKRASERLERGQMSME